MSSQPKCYQIKKPALHGHEVFARFHVPQNCEILQENPLWVLTPEQGQKVRDRAGDPQNLDLTRLGRFWSSLKREVQTKLYKVHGFKPATSQEGRQWCQGQYRKLGEHALKVYVFNALGRTTEPVIKTIVYDEASRFNHGCELSAEYQLNETNKSIIIAAARDLDAGDEITLQYTRPLASYAHRTKLLRERYDFACACALCSAD